MYGIKINKLPLHQKKGNTMIVKPFDIKNFNVYDIASGIEKTLQKNLRVINNEMH